MSIKTDPVWLAFFLSLHCAVPTRPGAPAAGAMPGQGDQNQDPAALAAQQAYYQQVAQQQQQQMGGAQAGAGAAPGGWGDFYGGAQPGGAPQQ